MAALEGEIVQSPLAHPIGHRCRNQAVFEGDEELHRILPFRLGTNRLRSNGRFRILKVPVDYCGQAHGRRCILDWKGFISGRRSRRTEVFCRRRRILRAGDINGSREDIGNGHNGIGLRLMIP